MKGYLVAHISRYLFTEVINFSWVYCRKAILYHCPNFMISVSLFPDNFIATKFDVVVCCSSLAEEVCDQIYYLHLVGFFIHDHEENEVGHGLELSFCLVV